MPAVGVLGTAQLFVKISSQAKRHREGGKQKLSVCSLGSSLDSGVLSAAVKLRQSGPLYVFCFKAERAYLPAQTGSRQQKAEILIACSERQQSALYHSMNCCKETRFLQSNAFFLLVMSLQNIHYSPFLQTEAVIFFISTHLLTICSTFVSCFWLKRSIGQSHLLEGIFRDSTVSSFHPLGKIEKKKKKKQEH